MEDQVTSFTKLILDAQTRYVPHKDHEQQTSDQPWFGPRCRAAAKAKYQAWQKLKRHPSEANKLRHRRAARALHDVQGWAIRQWQDDIKIKLQNGRLGSKTWWSMAKNKQSTKKETMVPPLISPEGELLLKAEVPPHFSIPILLS